MKHPNDQPGEFTKPGEVRIVRLLPGPIERIWDYLTDPEKRAKWFAGGPMEPRQGGKVELFFHHKNIAPDETPKMNGSASGLRTTACKTAPATARDAPTTSPSNARGRRNSQMIRA